MPVSSQPFRFWSLFHNWYVKQMHWISAAYWNFISQYECHCTTLHIPCRKSHSHLTDVDMMYKHKISPNPKMFKLMSVVRKVLLRLEKYYSFGIVSQEKDCQFRAVSWSWKQYLNRIDYEINDSVIQHDNAHPYTRHQTQSALAKLALPVLLQPTHNPDLVSSDFFFELI